MLFALTTRWNAGRHVSGEEMIEEILALGFPAVELGYNLRMDLVPGVQKMVQQKAVVVTSVHNFCPVPVGAPAGHPELFTLADPDPRVRQLAVQHTSRTIRFAAETGARAVVLHAGNVDMKRLTDQLLTLYEHGQQFSPKYEKIKLKLLTLREKKARRQIEYLYQGIEALLPVLDECGIRLGIENLPNWETIPTETEVETLLKHFNSPRLGCWHDIGHAAVRRFLGFISVERWMERLQDYLVGMHIHDARPPAMDHLIPPRGEIDFSQYKRYAAMNICRVFEPGPTATAEEIKAGLDCIKTLWSD
mgnify:CR=1 FL=1